MATVTFFDIGCNLCNSTLAFRPFSSPWTLQIHVILSPGMSQREILGRSHVPVEICTLLCRRLYKKQTWLCLSLPTRWQWRALSIGILSRSWRLVLAALHRQRSLPQMVLQVLLEMVLSDGGQLCQFPMWHNPPLIVLFTANIYRIAQNTFIIFCFVVSYVCSNPQIQTYQSFNHRVVVLWTLKLG